MTPDELLARVLHRDGLMLIIDKPPGLPVHAGPGGGENLEHYLDALRFGLPQPPHLAHRLDRDTSGCLVLGRHRKALARLGRLFEAKLVRKTYWAVVQGHPPEREGRIDMPLAKRSEKRGWWMTPDPAGQSAITDYRVLGAADDITWLEMLPQTGRTHQLRVHCLALGMPILGDTIYGGAPRFLDEPTLHLHARAVVVPISPGKPPVEAAAPPPPHMSAALERCGYVVL